MCITSPTYLHSGPTLQKGRIGPLHAWKGRGLVTQGGERITLFRADALHEQAEAGRRRRARAVLFAQEGARLRRGRDVIMIKSA